MLIPSSLILAVTLEVRLKMDDLALQVEVLGAIVSENLG